MNSSYDWRNIDLLVLRQTMLILNWRRGKPPPLNSTRYHSILVWCKNRSLACLNVLLNSVGINIKPIGSMPLERYSHQNRPHPLPLFCLFYTRPPHPVAMSTGRAELKTLSFAFEAWRSLPINKIIAETETNNKKTTCIEDRTVWWRERKLLLTSLFQLVNNVIESSRSICTTSPHMIPNQSPCSEFKLKNQLSEPISNSKYI